MADMPESVQVGPLRFTIKHDDLVSDAANCWGRIDYARQAIHLDSRQERDHVRVTLLHEMLHGVFRAVGTPYKNEEQIITTITATLLDTLRRNPAMVAYLTAED